VLDINAGTGLLTWEALRRAPEGGAWLLTPNADEAAALREMVARLSQVERPVVLQGRVEELPKLLELRAEASVRFDAIIGRSALAAAPDKAAVAQVLAGLLAAGGTLSLAEPLPRETQRLYALVDLARLDAALAAKVRAAEEAIYADPADPLVMWTAADLAALLAAAGLADVQVEPVETVADARIGPALLDRWFAPMPTGERPSYVQRLAAALDADEIAAVERLYRGSLTGATVAWRSVTVYVVGRRNRYRQTEGSPVSVALQKSMERDWRHHADTEVGLHGPAPDHDRVRRVGGRRTVGVRLGTAGRRRLHRGHPARARPGHQLDRHGSRIRPRSLGGDGRQGHQGPPR